MFCVLLLHILTFFRACFHANGLIRSFDIQFIIYLRPDLIDIATLFVLAHKINQISLGMFQIYLNYV